MIRKSDRRKLLVWLKGGLAQRTASVVMDCNRQCNCVCVCSQGLGSYPILLGEEGSYIPDRDAGVETELMGCCNCMICMCWIYSNDCDYWRWLVRIAGRRIRYCS